MSMGGRYRTVLWAGLSPLGTRPVPVDEPHLLNAPFPDAQS
jgi:hypothetical protein